MNLVLGKIVIDMNARRVYLDGDAKNLSPKAVAVLEQLTQANGEVVDRETLLDTVWPGVHVGEEVLTQAIAELRRTLGDNARHPQFVETIARKGYRLLVTPEIRAAPVQAEPRAVVGEDTPAPQFKPTSPSVVIVPFDALSGGSEAQTVSIGLGRDIGVSLARSRWLFVSARASAVALSGDNAEPMDIARRLGVRYALWGSVILSGGRLRLMANLCDSESGAMVWAERYDREIDDLFDLINDIGQEIAATVESEIEQHLRRVARIAPIATLDAWGLYHRAAHFRYAAQPEHFAEASQLLHRAHDLDPGAARIAAALASLELRQQMFLEPRGCKEALKRASRLAHEAITLDASEPEAQVAMGCTLWMNGQDAEAIDWLRQAVDGNPSAFNARNLLAWHLLVAGEREAALEHIAVADRLSPLDPIGYSIHVVRAQAYALQGDLETAMSHSERAVLHPNANDQVTAIAAWCSAAAGRTQLARRHAHRLRQSRPDFVLEDFFTWFKFAGEDREIIQRALRDAGL